MKRDEPGIHFIRVRKVKTLERANQGDAGLDFFFPEDLTVMDLLKANSHPKTDKPFDYIMEREIDVEVARMPGEYYNPLTLQSVDVITAIRMQPLSRILIPSGIRVLLGPIGSMLQANNKSGVSTQKGLIFGAEVVDSPYVGEVHISLINVSKHVPVIRAGEKLVQFVHVPVFQTVPNEIAPELYESYAKHWGTRGTGGFCSSGDGLDMEEELKLRDAQNGNDR